MEGEPSSIPDQPADQGLGRRPLRPDHALRHPRARHGLDPRRHRAAVASPGRTAARSSRFSDYMRPAVRIAALMQLPAIYVWTHDSIGLGEDGPTHQPVEHLAALRAIPGLDVVRPADANETAVAWRTILQHNDRPTGLILSPAEPADRGPDRRVARVGRRRGQGRVRPGRGRRRHAAGDHRQHRLRGADRPGRPNCLAGQRDCHPRGVDAVPRVVLRAGPGLPRRGVPAGDQGAGQHRGRGRPGWRDIVGDTGRIVSLEHYGASADQATLYREFGLTADAVAQAARDSIATTDSNGSNS